MAETAPSMEAAVAAGCMQAVMSLLYPELSKFVAFQRERVARTDAEDAQLHNGRSRQSRFRPAAPDRPDDGLTQPADVSSHLKYLRQHWHSHLRRYGLDPELPAVVQRALNYRNQVAHQSNLTLQQYEAAIATFQRLAEIIECNSTIREQIKTVVQSMMGCLSPKPREEEKASNPPDEYVPAPAAAGQIPEPSFYDNQEEEELWVDLKLIGNDYFQEKNYSEAIEAYSQALEVAPHEAVLYGNRAMCHLKRKEFDLAREDAEDAMDQDGRENIKFFRLLSEALMGLKEYSEAKEICDQGLQLQPQDRTLLARQSKADALAKEERARFEEEKRRREQEERAKLAAANAAAAAATVETEQPSQEQEKPAKKKANAKGKGKKTFTPDLELAPMINYQEVFPKSIIVHTLCSRKLEVYKHGLKCMVMGVEMLVDVTDSVVESGKPKLPVAKMIADAIANLQKAGEAGVAEAWFRLGMIYSSAIREEFPTTPDPHKMVEYLRKAATCLPFIQPPGKRVFRHQGVAEAENELGVCYRDGKPASVLESNPEKAFQFFLRSAKHDFPTGQYNVSVAYTIGFGTAVNGTAARLWASRAAQHGLPEAQQHFADLLERGFGGKRDASQAREWALTASQNRLANLMLKPENKQTTAVADIFATNPISVKQGKNFWRLCNMYLSEDGFDDEVSSSSDSDDDESSKLSYTPIRVSSSEQLDQSGIFRPRSAVVDAEVQVRAKRGSLTAYNYFESGKLLENAASFLTAGDVQSGLRDLRKADLLWDRPMDFFSTSLKFSTLLPKALEEASLSLQLNPRDLDAAYVIGRWQVMSDDDIILHWKRCVKTHPDEASFHFYLGTAYMTIRRYEDAQSAMEAALAIEKRTDWLYWLASPMVAMGLVDAAKTIFEEYLRTSAPEDRFVPDAYYALGALAFKTLDCTLAVVYHELGQMAESVAVRFPAYHPRVMVGIPKETLRASMKANGYMESSVIASIITQATVECGFCKGNIKPTQLLNHKMYKCPRRSIVCQECGAQMVFDDLQAHQQSNHPSIDDSKKVKANGNHGTSSFDHALSAPQFHFAGAILEISTGKNKPTVFTLQTVAGKRWILKVTGEALEATDGAAVQNAMVVFWRNSPPLEMIDRRVLTVPGADNIYGQDVAVYVLKCSVQTLSFELRELRQNTHVENGTLCSCCNCPPLGGSSLSVCGSCKVVKYCSRECQKIHWKRVHRFMCQNPVLLASCNSQSHDIAPNGRSVPLPVNEEAAYQKPATEAKPSNPSEHGAMLEILEDIVKTVNSGGDDDGTGSGDPRANEYYMLPSRSRDTILGSIRVIRRTTVNGSSKGLFAQFSIGYLTAVPTPLQQQELHYFFQIPPHNPLQLKHHGMEVHLEKSKAMTDDRSGRGFRMEMELPLVSFPLPALAELLDYLLTNTNLYLP